MNENILVADNRSEVEDPDNSVVYHSETASKDFDQGTACDEGHDHEKEMDRVQGHDSIFEVYNEQASQDTLEKLSAAKQDEPEVMEKNETNDTGVKEDTVGDDLGWQGISVKKNEDGTTEVEWLHDGETLVQLVPEMEYLGAMVMGFFPEFSSGFAGALERSGHVQPGDVVVGMNGMDVRDLEFMDILQSVKPTDQGGMPRPLTLKFLCSSSGSACAEEKAAQVLPEKRSFFSSLIKGSNTPLGRNDEEENENRDSTRDNLFSKQNSMDSGRNSSSGDADELTRDGYERVSSVRSLFRSRRKSVQNKPPDDNSVDTEVQSSTGQASGPKKRGFMQFLRPLSSEASPEDDAREAVRAAFKTGVLCLDVDGGVEGPGNQLQQPRHSSLLVARLEGQDLDPEELAHFGGEISFWRSKATTDADDAPPFSQIVGKGKHCYKPSVDDIGHIIRISVHIPGGIPGSRDFYADSPSPIYPDPQIQARLSNLLQEGSALFKKLRPREGNTNDYFTLELGEAFQLIKHELDKSKAEHTEIYQCPASSKAARISLDSCRLTTFLVNLGAPEQFQLVANSWEERELIALAFRSFQEKFKEADHALMSKKTKMAEIDSSVKKQQVPEDIPAGSILRVQEEEAKENIQGGDTTQASQAEHTLSSKDTKMAEVDSINKIAEADSSVNKQQVPEDLPAGSILRVKEEEAKENIQGGDTTQASQGQFFLSEAKGVVPKQSHHSAVAEETEIMIDSLLHEEYQEILAQAEQQTKHWRSKCLNLEAEVRKLKASLESGKRALEMAMFNSEEASAKLDSRDLIVKAMTAEADKANNQCEIIRKELDLTKSSLEGKDLIILAERTNVQDLQEHIVELEDRMKTYAGKETELSKTVKGLENDIRILNASIEVRDQKISFLEAQLVKEQAEADKARRRSEEIKALEEALGRAEQDRTGALQMQLQLEARIGKLLQQKEAAENNAKRCTEKMHLLSRDLQEQTSKVTQLITQRNSFKNKSDSLGRDITRLCRGKTAAEVEHILSSYDSLQVQTSLLRAERDHAVDEASTFKDALEGAQKVNEMMKGKGAAQQAVAKSIEMQRLLTDLTETIGEKDLQITALRDSNKMLAQQLFLAQQNTNQSHTAVLSDKDGTDVDTT